MPNWCNNNCEITGPSEIIEKLWETATEGEGLLSAMVPLHNGEWDYNDAVSTWGTKWDVGINDSGLELDKHGKYATISGYFDSAWGPPDGAFNTWLIENETCEAELLFCEMSMDFCGDLESGTMSITDQTRDFWLADSVGSRINDTFDILDTMDEYAEEDQNRALLEPLTLNNPEEDPS